MDKKDETEMTVEVRCPVDHLLFFRCSAQCSGTLECYCRRCRMHYAVELPQGVLKSRIIK